MDKTHLSISNSRSMDASSFALKIMSFIPLVMLVVSVNIWIDPEALYRQIFFKKGMREYRLAQELVNGRDVAIEGPNIDDRLLEKYFIENTKVVPDLVIMGSSRSMWLGENIFSHEKVFNHSVVAPVLGDFLGFFEGYAKRKLFPKSMIIVLDPQLVSYPFANQQWLSIQENTYQMLGRLKVHSHKFKRPFIPRVWLNVFSFSYFQRSMAVLWRGNHQRGSFLTQNTSTKNWLLKDGRHLLRFPPGRHGGKSIRAVLGGKNGPLGFQLKPDQELEDILDAFIRYLLQHHVKVILCFLPFNPEVYNDAAERQEGRLVFSLTSVEEHYRALAQKLNLKIIGSYNPLACNLGVDDFFDASHIRNEAIERSFRQKSSCFMPEK